MSNLESDAATAIVPQNARMSRLGLTMAWWGCCSAMFYVFLGAKLAMSYGTANAMLGMASGVLVFAWFGNYVAGYALRTGLSTSLISILIFGRRGATLATLLLFVVAVYYAVFEGSVLAVAGSQVVPHLSYATACIIIALYSAPLTIGSVQHFLNRLNGVLLPVYAGGLVLLIVLAIRRHGYSEAWLRVGPASGLSLKGWWSCFVAYAGLAVLVMVAIDFARFGRVANERYHRLLNFGAPFFAVTYGVNGFVGIFLVATVSLATVTETSVLDATLATLGSWAGLVFVWVTQTRINTANYYVSTVNAQSFFEGVFPVRWPRAAWAVFIGVIVLILMRSTSVFSYMLTALNYQGIFLTAWVGCALRFVRANRILDETAAGRALATAPEYQLRPMIAWFTAAVAGVAVAQSDSLSSLAPVVAFTTAFAIYQEPRKQSHSVTMGLDA